MTKDMTPNTTGAVSPNPSVVEAVARAISAVRMKLQKDPLGERVPDDLWVQSIPHAEAALAALNKDQADAG